MLSTGGEGGTALQTDRDVRDASEKYITALHSQVVKITQMDLQLYQIPLPQHMHINNNIHL